MNAVGLRTLAAFAPPPKLKLSEWIEGNISLPDDSAVPGPMRLWPWQIGIADAISDPMAERVTLLKASRIGFTALTIGAIGAHVVNEPASILILLPTESDARDFIVSDVEPTFGSSPALKRALSADREEAERDTLTSRRFTGGSLKIVAAKAPRNLRRHTARILIVDEADACEAGAEGDPIKLAERRTMTFANRKIVIGSTPVFSDASPVLKSYQASDQRIFEVPCPACGACFEILWQHIVWPKDADGKEVPEQAGCECPHCKALIAERHKAAMVSAGQWRATRPEVEGHAGFRLNSLVSLLANASWAKLADEFLAAKDDPAQLQVFTNTVLAQGWQSPSQVDENALMARAEPFGLDNVPVEVLIVTCGIDVQDDRVECSIIGWSRDSTAWVLAHHVIFGGFEDDSLWQEIDELLRSRWRHPLGGSLKVDAACIDCSDGDHFDKVLNFCVPKMGRRIFASKGMAGARPAFQMAKGKTIAGRMAIIGVDGLKNVIFDRLTRGRQIRFSNSLEPVYYEQLASERRVVRYRMGRPVRRFEPVSARVRNEAIDCATYAFAARSQVHVSFDRREDELKGQAVALRPMYEQLATGAMHAAAKPRDPSSEFRQPDRRFPRP
jgi:phage terminase large subunit GpA-like protein